MILWRLVLQTIQVSVRLYSKDKNMPSSSIHQKKKWMLDEHLQWKFIKHNMFCGFDSFSDRIVIHLSSAIPVWWSVVGARRDIRYWNYHGETAADLPPLSKSATSGDEVLVLDDLVNDFIFSYIFRNVALIFVTTEALTFLLSLRLLVLKFLCSTRRPLSM